MRQVSLSDMGQVLSWRNSEAGIKYSKTNSSIPKSQHRDWFESRLLRNAHEPYLIFSIKEQDIGSVRFDIDQNNSNGFMTSILLNPDFIGRGYGSRILSLAIKYMTDNYPDLELTAEIHDLNFASIKIFLDNHFALLDKVGLFGVYRFITID